MQCLCDILPRVASDSIRIKSRKSVKVIILTTGREFGGDFLAGTITFRGVCVGDFFLVERMSRVRLPEHGQVQG
jgi:hypothetical protein